MTNIYKSKLDALDLMEIIEMDMKSTVASRLCSDYSNKLAPKVFIMEKSLGKVTIKRIR